MPTDVPLGLKPLQVHETSWTPDDPGLKVTLNLCLDGCIVPCQDGSARIDKAGLVVLDGLLADADRQSILGTITEPDWDHQQGPPGPKWQRSTCDAAGRPRTWGLSPETLANFMQCQLPAKLELQSRLVKLYPEYQIVHMPADQIQGLSGAGNQPSALEESGQINQEGTPGHSSTPEVDCCPILANAAVEGDKFSWHVDADPINFFDRSPWVQNHGHYVNREPGKPLFVSMIVYLNAPWPREWDGETLVLDTGTDTGVIIRPKGGRVVLMDQDIVHRLSPPSWAAGGQPRYSLVWKLVFLPLHPGQRCSLHHPKWGKPTAFGSAALVEQTLANIRATGKRARKCDTEEEGQK